ncbi:MAG: glycosyltransferase [Pirellulales bacterium]
MVHYTAIVSVSDAAEPVKRLIAELGEALERLLLPYEIICVDDASPPATPDPFHDWLSQRPQLRVLRFDRPRGASAALSAGIAAARGDLILSIDPRLPRAAEYVSHLISRLSRFDFVTAEQARTLPQALFDRLTRLPRLLATQRRGNESLCFAANRPAVAGLALSRGACRVLPELVAMRGFRVGRMIVGDGLPPRTVGLRLGKWQRLIASCFGRRFEPHLARELRPDGTTEPLPTIIRAERMPGRVVAPRPSVPLGHQHGNPA